MFAMRCFSVGTMTYGDIEGHTLCKLWDHYKTTSIHASKEVICTTSVFDVFHKTSRAQVWGGGEQVRLA